MKKTCEPWDSYTQEDRETRVFISFSFREGGYIQGQMVSDRFFFSMEDGENRLQTLTFENLLNGNALSVLNECETQIHGGAKM